MDPLLLGMALVLAVLGIVLLLEGMRDWHWRRALFATAFVTGGLVIAWVRFGDGWSSSREIVLVISTDATDDAIRSLLAEFKNLEPATPVAFVLLDRDAATDGRYPRVTDAMAWRRCDERLRGPETLVRQAQVAGLHVNPESDTWIYQVALACTNLFDRPGRWLTKATVVFVHDKGSTWANANFPAVSVEALDTLIKRLVSHSDAEAYLYSAGEHSERGGSLTLRTNEHVIPAAQTVKDLGAYKVELLLRGCPESLRPEDLTVDATLLSPKTVASASGNAGTGVRTFTWQGTPMKKESTPEMTSVFTGYIPLNGLIPEGSALNDYTFEAGFHLIKVKVTALKDTSEAYEYQAQLYLNVGNSDLLVLKSTQPDHKGLGMMASQSWDEWAQMVDVIMPNPNPPPIGGASTVGEVGPEDLIKYYFTSNPPLLRFPKPPINYDRLPATRYNQELSPIDPDQAVKQAELDRKLRAPSLDALLSKLDKTRTLIILEPTLPELVYLDKVAGLESRIQRGLNVLVAGPPPLSASSSLPLPPWLHTTAMQADGVQTPARALQVHRDRRLYFVFDDARFLSFPYDDANPAITPEWVQAQIASKLLARLGGDQTDAFKVSGGLIRSDAKIHYLKQDAKRPEAPAEYLAVMPPLAHRVVGRGNLFETDYDGPNGAGVDLGYQLDIVPDHLGLRIASLLQNPAAKSLQRHLRPLIRGDLYPGTDVVIFVSDLPQLPDDKISAIPNLEFSTSIANDDTFKFELPPEGWPSVQTLAEMGIRVHLVRLQFAARVPGHQAYLKTGKALDECLALRNPIRATPPGLIVGQDWMPNLSELNIAANNDQQWIEVVNKLENRIKSHEPSRAVPVDRGRVIDGRVLDSARAPDSQMVLAETEQSPDPWRPPAAIVRDGAGLRELPLIVERGFGQGQVVVTAYTPFAADVWNADAAHASPLASRAGPSDSSWYYQGWGIQRIADLITFAGAVRPLPATRLVLKSISIFPDRSGFDVLCWGNFGQAAWSMPRLVGNSLNEEFSPLLIDPRGQMATFRFLHKGSDGRSAPLTGTFMLKLGDVPEDNRAICLDLASGGLGGADLLPALLRVAEFTGGSRIENSGVGLPPRYRRSPGWLGVLLLSLNAVFMFSPAARSWTAFSTMLRRLWVGRPDRLQSSTMTLDAQSFLIERGMSSSRPKSGQLAGLPAGEKQYESGDRLTSARASSLLPFSASFAEVPLPQRVPSVRLRHVTRSFECFILVDNTPGLSIPEKSPYPTKAAYCKFLAQVIGGMVWQQDGVVHCACTDGSGESWGPSTGSGDMEGLGTYVQASLERARWGRPNKAMQVLAEGMGNGQIVFLLSDLLARTTAEVAALTQLATNAGTSLRVVRFFDPEESTLIGIARQPGVFSIYDRAEATPKALRQAYEHHGRQMVQVIEAKGGRAITIETSRTLSDLAELLEETQWLNP